ncbi:hypothetical protein EF888_08135 [Silicimonas algicola]|uniref:Uncharacterized protein n=2 Tax=Silicimonas algicola TaxID=1826607 RepID=A0A316G4W7_9RHOB|nr:hypothetical protein [Silicimonas algicola]AZQ67106.1 hypothetical protein EF888_08135 [Silicimonas algicola]PWK55365.1 hypothetical protein C8D95_10730 [Silicimonas algicola]
MIRGNPLRALLTTFAAGAMPDVPGISVGSPITDNFLSVTNEGRLGYSVGPQMLFHAPALNPWLQVIH